MFLGKSFIIGHRNIPAVTIFFPGSVTIQATTEESLVRGIFRFFIPGGKIRMFCRQEIITAVVRAGDSQLSS